MCFKVRFAAKAELRRLGREPSGGAGGAGCLPGLWGTPWAPGRAGEGELDGPLEREACAAQRNPVIAKVR